MNFSIGKLTGRAELGYAALAANPEKKEDDSESPRSLPSSPPFTTASCPSVLFPHLFGSWCSGTGGEEGSFCTVG